MLESNHERSRACWFGHTAIDKENLCGERNANARQGHRCPKVRTDIRFCKVGFQRKAESAWLLRKRQMVSGRGDLPPAAAWESNGDGDHLCVPGRELGDKQENRLSALQMAHCGDRKSRDCKLVCGHLRVYAGMSAAIRLVLAYRTEKHGPAKAGLDTTFRANLMRQQKDRAAQPIPI
jgi:hypothetical protein